MKTHIEPPPPPAQWMISFADLLSLILTFFVLLYSMSAVDKSKWEKVTATLSKQLNPTQAANRTENPTGLAVPKQKIPDAVNLDYLSSVMQDKFRDVVSLKRNAATTLESDRLVVTLTQEAFAPGQATLKPALTSQLDLLSNALYAVGNHVDVYAYATAEENSKGSAYPSQWELALARAESVSQALRNMGYPYKITSFARSGEASAQSGVQTPKPAAPSVTKAAAKPVVPGGATDHSKAGGNREQSPRRVDIVIRPYSAEW